MIAEVDVRGFGSKISKGIAGCHLWGTLAEEIVFDMRPVYNDQHRSPMQQPKALF